MSPAQKRYAMARAEYETRKTLATEIERELTTDDMTEDDEMALWAAVDEAVEPYEAYARMSAAEDEMVEWARQAIASKHQNADVDRLLAGDYKRFIAIRKKVVDLSFRLAVSA